MLDSVDLCWLWKTFADGVSEKTGEATQVRERNWWLSMGGMKWQDSGCFCCRNVTWQIFKALSIPLIFMTYSPKNVHRAAHPSEPPAQELFCLLGDEPWMTKLRAIMWRVCASVWLALQGGKIIRRLYSEKIIFFLGKKKITQTVEGGTQLFITRWRHKYANVYEHLETSTLSQIHLSLL